MTPIQAALTAVIVVFVLGLILLLAVVVFKWIHRRRIQSRNKRRAEYLRLISRHLADPTSTQPLTVYQAEDDAFIDAVIDVRNTVVGPAVDSLEGLVDGTGLISLQAERLRSRFPLGRRLRAVVSLAEIGDSRAARVLMQHLSDREPEVRVQCARGLARMGYTPAIDLILERFNEETPWVRTRFAEALISFGRDASWPLTAFVRVNHTAPNNFGVPEAVRVIGRIGDLEVGPALAELLYTVEDLEVMLALIESLGQVGGPLAVRPLRKMFAHDDWRVRAKTATALGEIGDPSVNPVLVTGLSDSSWWTRRNCAAGLAHLPNGIDCLYDALTSRDEFARDAASEALADVGELAAAIDRMDAGVSQPRDLRLVGYMEQPGMVFS